MFFLNSNPPVDLTGINHKYYENIQYGNTNREILDIFIPTDPVTPTGLVIYMHAGGFVQWDKSRGYSESLIQDLLNDGIAYATINYDLIETQFERKGILSSMDSGKRAVQFLK